MLVKRVPDVPQREELIVTRAASTLKQWGLKATNVRDILKHLNHILVRRLDGWSITFDQSSPHLLPVPEQLMDWVVQTTGLDWSTLGKWSRETMFSWLTRPPLPQIWPLSSDHVTSGSHNYFRHRKVSQWYGRHVINYPQIVQQVHIVVRYNGFNAQQ